MQLAKLQMGLTLEAAHGGTQVSKLKKINEDYLIDCVGALIISLLYSLNIGKTMDKVQVYEASCTLITKYWFLKLEELVFIFKEGKSGAYGELYNRMDVQVLCHWCDKYLGSERLAALHEKRATEYKTAENQPMNLENAKRVAAMFQHHLEPKKVAKPIEIQPTTAEDWLRVFREEAEKATPEELEEISRQAKSKDFKDVWEIADTLLGEYAAGIRTLPKAS